MSIYEGIGVKRVINAAFCLTVLGGSTLSKEVIEATTEANRYFVEMRDLCTKVGEIIAGITGAEAAYPTTGAFGALVLAAAACIAGKDTDKMRRLPDTTGMKNEVIIQRNLRIVFDRAMEVPGGKFAIKRCVGVENIGKAWKELVNWRAESEFKAGKIQCLEKHIGRDEDVNHDTLTLDLYLSIEK